MPRLISSRVPSYRRHKQSGQAIITLNGKDILLGKHGSAASKIEYNRRVAEWIANGRQAPQAAADLSMTELISRYKTHVEVYYRHTDGTSTTEVANIRCALKPLRELYGTLPASEFSPLKLKGLQQVMIQPRGDGNGWSRKHINKCIDRIRGMFKWAVGNELIPASVYHGLLAVAGLKAGRCDARETEPVRPADDAIVDATLPHLTSVARAMVQLQRLTGARPGEICSMRIGDMDRSGEVWKYTPQEHKTQHHGRARTIFIGPRAQEILSPFLLKLDGSASVFSPADSMAEMRQRRSEARKTPLGYGNRPGSNRKRKPKRLPGNGYNVAAYRRAITRAAELAFPVPGEISNDATKAKAWRKQHHWHPHQLRHSAATDIRRQFGLEAAQHVLGHATADMTEIYAEKNHEIARSVAAKIG